MAPPSCPEHWHGMSRLHLSYIGNSHLYRPVCLPSHRIHHCYTITQLLSQHDYVIVLALDFSKAFDSVRHSTLFDKLARLYIPDHVYNWLVEYFQDHSHCTKYENNTSALADISASIIHGSAIGPASYVVHASDLVSITAGNSLCKYADDT